MSSGVEWIGAADRLGRLEGEAAGEYRQAREEGLLLLVQQVVRPVDQRPQRLLARLQRAVPAGQDLVAVVEPLVDVGDRERAHPRRCQLQRQRNALEPRHQLGDRRGLALGERESGLVELGALDEELDGGRLRQRLEARRARRQRQRLHDVGLLPGDAQRDAAGRQDANVGRGAQDRAGELCARVDHLLAVVEDQHHRAGLEVRRQRLQQRPPRFLAHAEHARRLARDQRSVADRLQVDEPDAVGVQVHHVCTDLQ